MGESTPPPTEDDRAVGGGTRAALGASTPYPIEIALRDGTVLRGVEHPADGPPLLFVHDFGDDLDAWGPLARTVAASGFRVIRLELRGHGLSDGEPDASAVAADMAGALAEVTGAFGPVGLVSYGAAASTAFSLDSSAGAPVHAVISPAPPAGGGGGGEDGEDGHDGDGGPVPAVRVLFTGAHDTEAHEYVRSIHPGLLGQNMWISTGTVLRGPSLLRENPHLVEQLVMFMRRYLTAHHLAWIAEHTPDDQDAHNQSRDPDGQRPGCDEQAPDRDDEEG